MSTHKLETFTVLLEAIDRQIIAAGISTTTARQALGRGRNNEAIGALIPVDNHLRLAIDLLAAALAVHRTPLPEQEGGRR